MRGGQQGLQALFGQLIGLLQQILDLLQLVFHVGGLLGELFELAGDLVALLFLGEGVVGPALLVIGFEGDPFLAEAVFGQALDLGDLVDAALDALGEVFQRGLGALGLALGGIELQELRFNIASLLFDGLEAHLPVFPDAVAFDGGEVLLIQEGGHGVAALGLHCRQLVEAGFQLAQGGVDQLGLAALVIRALAQGSHFALQIYNTLGVLAAAIFYQAVGAGVLFFFQAHLGDLLARFVNGAAQAAFFLDAGLDGLV